jgi:hypothetical protein
MCYYFARKWRYFLCHLAQFFQPMRHNVRRAKMKKENFDEQAARDSVLKRISRRRVTTWRDTLHRWQHHLSLSRALDEQQALLERAPLQTLLTMVTIVVGGGIALYFLVPTIVAIESQENGWQLVWQSLLDSFWKR